MTFKSLSQRLSQSFTAATVLQSDNFSIEKLAQSIMFQIITTESTNPHRHLSEWNV